MTRNTRTTLCLSLTIACAAALVTACNTPPIMGLQHVTLDTAFDRTGTLRSDGAFTGMTDNNSVIAGDEGNTGMAQRGFVSVVLNQIPAGANISSVILTLRASAPEGDPQGEFGAMTIDHVNVVSSINVTSFNSAPLSANVSSITGLPVGLAKAVIQLDITDLVKADVAAGRPITSLRFQYANAPSNDGNFDQTFIDANQNDIALRPTADVTIAP